MPLADSSGSKLPLMSLVVVNYNGREHLAECLDALAGDKYPGPVQLLLVDNASTDGSLTIAEEYAATSPHITLLRSSTNRGYAGGVNFALPSARGRYVVVLNMDLIVTPGWLTSLVEFMEANPGAGAASPLLVLAEDPGRINAIGQDVHVTGLGFNRGLWRPVADLAPDPVRVSGIHGGAFIIRRDVLERAGGMDDTGFLYHEDVEISWLVHLMGYDLYCVPRAVVRHKYVLTMYAEKLFLLERNRVAMLFEHLAAASWVLLAPLLACTEAMMWGYCLLRGRRFMQAKAASYRWLVQQRAVIRERRAAVQALRQRSDRQVLARLAWSYKWDQFLTLGRERGPSGRQPAGGLPVKIGDAT